MLPFRLLLAIGVCAGTVRACYQSSWSPWINDYKPSTKLFPQERKEGITKGGGDIETMSQTERDRFCNPGQGTITNIECETVDGRSYNTTGWAHLECSVDTGFKCSNRFSAGLCADYRIRLYCRCNNPLPPTTTKGSISVTAGVTSGPPSSSGRQVSVSQPTGSKNSTSSIGVSSHGANIGPTSSQPSQGNSKTSAKKSSSGSTNAPGLLSFGKSAVEITTSGVVSGGKTGPVRTTSNPASVGSGSKHHLHSGGQKVGHTLYAVGVTVLSFVFLCLVQKE